MRRWNPLFLVVPLFLVAVLAPALVTPNRAMAAGASSLRQFPASSTNFKGKVVAKDRTDHYFVFTFTCTGTLSGKWTYEVSSTQSFTGTTGGTPACVLASAAPEPGVSYLPATDIQLLFNVNGQDVDVGTLSLSLTNIVASKTFFGIFIESPPPSVPEDCTSSDLSAFPPCVAVKTSDLVIPTTPTTTVAGFSLETGSFSTLNLSAR